MTEAEWLECDDLGRILTHLAYVAAGRSPRWYDWLTPWRLPALNWKGSRKLRLFACACARRVWHLLPSAEWLDGIVRADRTLLQRVRQTVASPACSQALLSAEEFAEGWVNRRDLNRAANEASAVAEKWPMPILEHHGVDPRFDSYDAIVRSGAAQGAAVWVSAWVSGGPEHVAAGSRAAWAAAAVASGERRFEQFEQSWREEERRQCHLLRDVIGTPGHPAEFRRIPRTADVLALAVAAYEEQSLPVGTLDSTCLAVLADALEEAGCTDASILSHLRGPGPHVRGCWALDLILGRE